ncbi:MAG: sugar ABC transporter substrate-binding protein [Acidobacteria bacterium]|nr:sugar ABC transporter substrate-binding protein [Acidobacteriota bacterium]
MSKQPRFSRREWLGYTSILTAGIAATQASCQRPVGTSSAPPTSNAPPPASSLVSSQLQGADAVIEKMASVLPERPPADWQWLENKRATVGLLMISTVAPYVAGYRKAFDSEARRLNMGVIALDANSDPARQAAQAEDLIGKRVDVLCFWPVDAKAIVPSVRKAYEAGIPLVCTNSWTEESVLHCFKSFIGASMVEEGIIAGQLIAEALNGRGKIAIIEGNPGQDATYWRSTAFIDELKRLAPAIEVLDRQTARWDRARATAVAENYLTTYSDLNAIMAQDDNMAVGALQAIKAAGKLQQVKLISINSSREGLEAIVAGEMYGSCTQSPTFEGIYTARVARDVANGWPPVPRWIRNPVMRVDKSNVHQVFGEW